MFGRKFDEKNPHAIGNWILPLRCSFGIGYGISRKYLQIWVSVSDRNKNSGFSRTLHTCKDHGTHQLRFCFDFHRWCWLLFCCCSNGCIRNGSVIQIFTVNRFNGEWFVFVGSLVCTLKK